MMFKVGWKGTRHAEWEEELDFENEQQAHSYARDRAFEDYENHCGGNGYMSWEECREELIHDPDYGEVSDKDVDEYYLDIVENTIEYWVIRM